jgi:ribonuclease HI
MTDTQQSIFDSMPLEVSLQDPLATQESVTWTIFIDGASRGNPGPSGAGVYIQKNKKFFAGHGFYLGIKTNNEAEYYALLLAIFLVKKEASSQDTVHIISDSQLLIKQMLGVYRVKKSELQVFYTIAKQETLDMQITFEHVLREKNTHADALANEGVDKKKSLPLKFLDMLQRYEVFI